MIKRINFNLRKGYEVGNANVQSYTVDNALVVHAHGVGEGIKTSIPFSEITVGKIDNVMLQIFGGFIQFGTTMAFETSSKNVDLGVHVSTYPEMVGMEIHEDIGGGAKGDFLGVIESVPEDDVVTLVDFPTKNYNGNVVIGFGSVVGTIESMKDEIVQFIEDKFVSDREEFIQKVKDSVQEHL